jgi:hypothetical protein
MSRTFLGALLIAILMSPVVRAQRYIPAGSTPEGDYLRGVGIAAAGMGIYNEKTAIADSINTQTAMTWNDYVSQAIRNQGREHEERKRLERAKHAAAKEEIEKRLRDNPDDLDVMNGDALNKVLKQLWQPGISDSSFRYAEVPLPIDLVRRIRFKLGERNEKFSMSRLSLRGKGKWPVAFRGPEFASYRRAYELALDHALEQAIEGKLQTPAISAVDKAVDDLSRRLNDVFGPIGDPIYIEAKQRLEELKKVVGIFKIQKIEQALGELDRYPGTTVNDLRLFMRRHNLQFAPAETPDEKTLYPQLNALLRLQREKVMDAAAAPGK